MRNLAMIFLLAMLPACIPDKRQDPADRLAVYRHLAAPARDYFQERYAGSLDAWFVLGPFPSPLNPMDRDLLINDKGEAQARPSSGTVRIPPRTEATWQKIRPFPHDIWIPQGLSTRYTGFVPIHQGQPGRGSETVLAYGEMSCPTGGLHRILFKPWGSGRLLLNGKPVVDRVDFHQFFGQWEVFTRLENGINRLLVKQENLTYNSTAQAETIFGSWGFYLDAMPAARLGAGLFLDIPFVEDVTRKSRRLFGKLAIRNRKPREPAMPASPSIKSVTVTLGDASTQVAITAPQAEGVHFFPFLLTWKEPLTDETPLRIEQGDKLLLETPMTPRPDRDVLVMRSVLSPSDGTLQPYLLYVPPPTSKPPPLIVYLHEGNATEEALACWRSDLLTFAQDHPAAVLAPRGRGADILSGQAASDILLAIQDARAFLGLPGNARPTLAGHGQGGLCALKLAAHYPGRFNGVLLVPAEGYPDAQQYDPALLPVLHNLARQPVVIAAGETDLSLPLIVQQLTAHKIPMTPITLTETEAPFQQPAVERALAALLEQDDESPPPAAFQFVSPHGRARSAWWMGILSWQDPGAGRARVDALFNGIDTVTLDTENVAALQIHPGKLPGGRPDALKIIWNGTELIQGNPQKDLAIPLRWAGQGMGFEAPSLDGLFRSAHACVIPDSPGWDDLAEALLARRRGTPLFGRNVQDKAMTIIPASGYLPDDADNLILLGGPGNNKMIRWLAPHLPVDLTDEACTFKEKTFSLADHVIRILCRLPHAPDRQAAILTGRRLSHFAEDPLPADFNPLKNDATGQGHHPIRIWKWETYSVPGRREQIEGRLVPIPLD